jgi:hypothetical protein
MGVRKYRSASDMPGPEARRPSDAENLRLALGLADLARHLASLQYAPGVRKFCSYEEMKRARIRDPGTPTSR